MRWRRIFERGCSNFEDPANDVYFLILWLINDLYKNCTLSCHHFFFSRSLILLLNLFTIDSFFFYLSRCYIRYSSSSSLSISRSPVSSSWIYRSRLILSLIYCILWLILFMSYCFNRWVSYLLFVANDSVRCSEWPWFKGRSITYCRAYSTILFNLKLPLPSWLRTLLLVLALLRLYP